MKVLHICQRDDPDTGGSVRVCEALAHEQRAVGVEVWILFLYGPSGHMAEIFEPHSICLGLNSSREVISGLRAFKKAIRRVNPDLIHSHDGILWPRLAYIGLGIPVVTHAHLSGGCRGALKDRIGWSLVKGTSDRVIGISEHTSASWVDGGYSKHHLRLIPNGVDFNRFIPPSATERLRFRRTLGLPEEGCILLWVGRLHRDMKGTDRVERVVAALPENTYLVVVGQGPEYEGIMERCASALEEGKLVLAGSIQLPEAYYKAADGYLFTSYYEPFGLVLLEAVACGLPLLAFPVTRGGGATELLKEFEATLMDDEATADELVSAIETAMARRSFADELRQRAMDGYSWTALNQDLMDVYGSLLGEREG